MPGYVVGCACRDDVTALGISHGLEAWLSHQLGVEVGVMESMVVGGFRAEEAGLGWVDPAMWSAAAGQADSYRCAAEGAGIPGTRAEYIPEYVVSVRPLRSAAACKYTKE